MATKFADLKHKATPEQHAKTTARVAATLQTMALHELRRARKQTQKALAENMGTTQDQVSRIEARTQLHLGTLQDYVAGLGGKLELRAVFPEGAVQLELTK